MRQKFTSPCSKNRLQISRAGLVRSLHCQRPRLLLTSLVPNGCWRSSPYTHIPRTRRTQEKKKKGSSSAFKDNFFHLHLTDVRTKAYDHTVLQGKLPSVCIQGEGFPFKCEVNLKAKWRIDIWWSRSSL